jgi:long-chain acyl-CoA synthetase
VVATVLPNGAEMLEIYLAALQAGWYLVPINHHLVAPEIAYILKDSGAKVFVAHERFADACDRRRRRGGASPRGPLAVGEVKGFSSYARARDAQPTTLPEDRTLGDVMNYTSGTTGNPKGIFRKLLGVSPEQAALGLSGVLFLFSVQPQDDNVHIIGSPLYHTAVLRFGSASMHLGHTVVLMDKWTPEEMLRLIERYTGSPPRTWCRPNSTAAGPPRGSAEQVRRVLVAPHDPRRGAVPDRRQAQDDRLVGQRRRRVLRRQRGWRHAGHGRGVAGEARDGGQGVAHLRDCHLRRRRQPHRRAQRDRHGLHGDGTAQFEYHGDKEKTRKNRIGAFFTVGDVGLIDEDGYLFLRDRKIDMIISGWRQHLPGRDRERLALPPQGG